MVLVQKWPVVQLFFFRQYRPGNCLLRYPRAKIRLSKLQKQEVQKVEILTFFKSGKPMFLVQKWPFFQLFLANRGQENLFYDILERNNAFLGYKK